MSAWRAYGGTGRRTRNEAEQSKCRSRQAPPSQVSLVTRSSEPIRTWSAPPGLAAGRWKATGHELEAPRGLRVPRGRVRVMPIFAESSESAVDHVRAVHRIDSNHGKMVEAVRRTHKVDTSGRRYVVYGHLVPNGM